jgi:hypothetical protein
LGLIGTLSIDDDTPRDHTENLHLSPRRGRLTVRAPAFMRLFARGEPQMSDAAPHAFPHSLLGFNGLYLLNDTFDQFLLIDTDIYVEGTTSRLATTITISMGEFASQVIAYESATCKFDGTTLSIAYPGGAPLAVLQFYKNPIEGGVAGVNGAIYGRAVRGRSQFNPVPLSAFATEYFDPTGGHFVGRLRIHSDSTVAYKQSPDSPYLPIPFYKYNYAMFVLTVYWGSGAHENATFEMGTYPGAGRVAGILGNGGLWVSILQTS